MKHKLSEFWFWYKEPVTILVLGTIVISSAIYFLILGQANSYKYNCELDRKPNFYTTFFIDDSTYAYDPKGFCATLRERMANE
jgi:hypothetical protein